MEIVLLVLAAIVIVVGALITTYIKAIYKASEKIWHGSGDPISMSQMLLESLQANSQILFGVFALFVLFVLMSENVISSEAGLPLFSALAAYLLGKGFRESSFLKKDKEKKDDK